jgi:hypothetical protein
VGLRAGGPEARSRTDRSPQGRASARRSEARNKGTCGSAGSCVKAANALVPHFSSRQVVSDGRNMRPWLDGARPWDADPVPACGSVSRGTRSSRRRDLVAAAGPDARPAAGRRRPVLARDRPQRRRSGTPPEATPGGPPGLVIGGCDTRHPTRRPVWRGHRRRTTRCVARWVGPRRAGRAWTARARARWSPCRRTRPAHRGRPADAIGPPRCSGRRRVRPGAVAPIRSGSTEATSRPPAAPPRPRLSAPPVGAARPSR